MTIFKHEMKMNRKSLLIWTICVGFTCCGCLLLFGSLEDTMEEMAAAYSQLGTFSAALGMDRMNIGTIEGFYATEIALIFAIGGAMFAAMSGAAMLSKEEEGHTSEFLYMLPLGRRRIILEKYGALCMLILLFNVTCVVWEMIGFAGAGETLPKREYLLYHGAQILMHLTVGSVCFLISAVSRKKQIGAALGLAVLLYIVDLICRIMPDLENMKYVTPYYFSNATDIFTNGSVDGVLAGISAGIIVVCAGAALCIYGRRDLSA